MKNEQLSNALLLLKALRDGDSSAAATYKKLTGIQEKNYKKLSAILRFWQIGMADSYQSAFKLYQEDVERNNRAEFEHKNYQKTLILLENAKKRVDGENAKRDQEVYGFYEKQAADMKVKCDILEEKIRRLRNYR